MSLPKLVFPGGALIGDDAGFLNASRIKGSHAAIKSGMLAAEAARRRWARIARHDELAAYPEAYQQSWLHDELHRARNFKPWMSKGLYLGTLMFGIDQTLLRGKAPWTLHHDARSREAETGVGLQADRISQARRHAELRPAVLGVPVEHQP